jgi:hypothetical protein
MSLRHFIAAFAVVTLLAGCGSGPVRRITPSQVSIQELAVQPGGQWKLTLRIQNYSTVPMTYASLHGTLYVAGADVVDTTLHATAALPTGDIAYKIEGTIATSEPKEEFKFNRSSRLSPTPGLANTWR